MIAEIGVALHIGGSWLYSMRATLFLDYYEDLTHANKNHNDAMEKARKSAEKKRRDRGR